MTSTLTRRSALLGLGSLLVAPAIVHAGNLMPIRGKPLYMTLPELVDLIFPTSIRLRGLMWGDEYVRFSYLVDGEVLLETIPRREVYIHHV